MEYPGQDNNECPDLLWLEGRLTRLSGSWGFQQMTSLQNRREMAMQYKTVTLGLLEARSKLYKELRSQRMVKATMERLALDLKAMDEAWQEELSQQRPDSDPS